ncbi:MAG: hypothetical protein GXP38_05435 [Chloroflexi bacterium]|nr:hypothetical protein [Chloroflexota bacterium]
MQILKFKASVKNGIIRVPKQFQKQLPDRVQIIIFPEASKHKEDFIAQLLKHPLHIPDFQPLRREEIYDRTL